jgi:hypothetical protein
MLTNMHSVVGDCFSVASRAKGTIVGAHIDASQFDLSPRQGNKYEGDKNHCSCTYMSVIPKKRVKMGKIYTSP